MKTRPLSLFLIVAVLCSCMAVTVGATETGGDTLNVLDFVDVRTYTVESSMGMESFPITLPHETVVTSFQIRLRAFDSNGDPVVLDKIGLTGEGWSVISYPSIVKEDEGLYSVSLLGLAFQVATDELTLYVHSSESDYTIYLDLFSLTVEGYTPPAETSLLVKIWECLKAGDFSGAGNEILQTISDTLSSIKTSLVTQTNSIRSAISNMSADLSWYLEEIWLALTESSTQSDGYQDEVDNSVSELETMGDIMDSVERPDAPLDIPDEGNIEMLTNGGLLYAMTSPYILPLFVTSMTLCFVSYALFGKKG